MSKSILQSIKPQYCELIASGKKTIEVRKTRPKLDVPFKVYIYETKSSYINGLNGTVIGEYICDEVKCIDSVGKEYYIEFDDNEATCLRYDEIRKYGSGKPLYFWHISDLKIYDKPKELSEFHKPCKCLDEYEGEVYCDCLNCEDAGDSDYGIIACDRTITRPPQSWCYVEEV